MRRSCLCACDHSRCRSSPIVFPSPGPRSLPCTLCRSQRTAVLTLDRARRREVDVHSVAWWPKTGTSRWSDTDCPLTDPVIMTGLDDAFASIGQLMSTASRQCGRYLGSHPEVRKENTGFDSDHFHRYHQSPPRFQRERNPLSQSSGENVRVEVLPGTYAVTAGRWGKRDSRQHTHIVHLDPQQSVQLSFTV